MNFYLSIISVGPWSMPMMSLSCATASRNTSSQNCIWSQSPHRSLATNSKIKNLINITVFVLIIPQQFGMKKEIKYWNKTDWECISNPPHLPPPIPPHNSPPYVLPLPLTGDAFKEIGPVVLLHRVVKIEHTPFTVSISSTQCTLDTHTASCAALAPCYARLHPTKNK